MESQEIRFGMIRKNYENFRFVEYLHPKPENEVRGRFTNIVGGKLGAVEGSQLRDR